MHHLHMTKEEIESNLKFGKIKVMASNMLVPWSSGPGWLLDGIFIDRINLTQLRIQELDGTYHHTIQIEKNVTKVNLNCHSKKRNKKKKIPLLTGEEIDIDQSQTDQDSPLLWIRCDPDCFLIRQCKLKQPDYCLQYQVRYERDVIGQVEALNQLIDYPTANTVKALKETIESLEYFWRVRCHACEIMYKE